MNYKLSMLAIIEILSALSMGIFILAFTYQLLKIIGRKKFDIHSNNQAYGVFMGTILFSIGYLISSVIQPLLSLFRIFASRGMDTFSLALSFLGYGALFMTVAYFLAVIICFTGVKIYTFITPIDEFAELKNNNLSVAMVVGSIILTLSVLTHDGIAVLIESFIPYPNQFPK